MYLYKVRPRLSLDTQKTGPNLSAIQDNTQGRDICLLDTFSLPHRCLNTINYYCINVTIN